MSHHAYLFDEGAYRAELAPRLARALDDGDRGVVEGWLTARGIPALTSDSLEDLARHALGFFVRSDDIGLGEKWRTLRATLADLYPEGRVFVTGGEVASLGGVFVQSASYVAASAAILARLLAEQRRHEAILQPVHDLLASAAASGKGLLIWID